MKDNQIVFRSSLLGVDIPLMVTALYYPEEPDVGLGDAWEIEEATINGANVELDVIADSWILLEVEAAEAALEWYKDQEKPEYYRDERL